MAPTRMKMGQTVFQKPCITLVKMRFRHLRSHNGIGKCIVIQVVDDDMGPHPFVKRCSRDGGQNGRNGQIDVALLDKGFQSFEIRFFIVRRYDEVPDDSNTQGF